MSAPSLRGGGAWLLGLFALSGAAGLVYQSIWAHYLGLVLGHAAYAQTLVLGEAMPSGRTYDYVGETVLTGEDLSKMYDSIEKLIPKYGGKIEIQRSSFLKHQLLSCQSQPNSAVIVRPDGNVRLDCMTPFVIGNVKERPFLDIWREKGGDCWRHPKVKQYIDSVQGMNNWSDEVRNYADEDIWI